MADKYIVDCPRCGPVTGYVQDQTDREEDPSEPFDPDLLIEEEEFEGPGGIVVTRIRCPRCGTWLPQDRQQPA